MHVNAYPFPIQTQIVTLGEQLRRNRELSVRPDDQLDEWEVPEDVREYWHIKAARKLGIDVI